MFSGFPEETTRFFLDLRFHNETSYFHAHQTEYEQFVKAPFYAFIDALAPTTQQIADDMEVRPAKCLARIHRDTRFTKDKSPYRDHLWLLFRRAAEPRENSVMYWFEFGPDRLNWGLGFWGDNRPAMEILRQRMRQKPAEVQRVLRQCHLPAEDGLTIEGDHFSRMKIPEEVPPPLHALYAMKSLYVQRTNAVVREAYQRERSRGARGAGYAAPKASVPLPARRVRRGRGQDGHLIKELVWSIEC